MLKKIILQKIILTKHKLYIYKNIFLDYLYDAKRYVNYSTTIRPAIKKSELEARIIAHYHVIEKGLSFEKIQPEFGQNVIFSLINLLKQWEKNKFSTNNIAFSSAVSVLKEYISWHEINNFEIKNVKEKITKIKYQKNNYLGGIKNISKKQIDETRKQNFDIFSKNRHSIRNFSENQVSIEDIKESIKIAQRSPSACNRQSVKTYCVQNKDIKNKILKLQKGSRGFGHLADKLLIITSDLSCYKGIKEKNLGFIDGGIFSMSLMYSLHYMGIDSCALGWLATRDENEELKKLTKIKNSENIILILIIGYMKKNIKIAKSSKKTIDKITII